MNGGRNYNGPKVDASHARGSRKRFVFASLSKTWPYAGKSEYPALRAARLVTTRRVQTISRKGRCVRASESSETLRQAFGRKTGVKIKSGLHGDMQRSAETTGPAIDSALKLRRLLASDFWLLISDRV